MDNEIKVANGLNILDSLTTMFFLARPLAYYVPIEVNPIISFSLKNLGIWTYMIKILIGYYLFKWYNANYKKEKIYKIGMGIVLFVLCGLVLNNIINMVIAR